MKLSSIMSQSVLPTKNPVNTQDKKEDSTSIQNNPPAKSGIKKKLPYIAGAVVLAGLGYVALRGKGINFKKLASKQTESIVDGAKETVAKTAEKAAETVAQKAEAVKETVAKTAEKVAETVVEKAEAVKESVAKAVEAAAPKAEAVKETVAKAVETAAPKAEAAKETVAKAVEAAAPKAEAAKETVAKAVETAAPKAEAAKETVAKAVETAAPKAEAAKVTPKTLAETGEKLRDEYGVPGYYAKVVPAEMKPEEINLILSDRKYNPELLDILDANWKNQDYIDLPLMEKISRDFAADTQRPERHRQAAILLEKSYKAAYCIYHEESMALRTKNGLASVLNRITNESSDLLSHYSHLPKEDAMLRMEVFANRNLGPKEIKVKPGEMNSTEFLQKLKDAFNKYVSGANK